MRLDQLEPHLLRRVDARSWQELKPDTPLADVDGIRFLCPRCFETNGGAVGTHSVICWSPKVPLDMAPGPGRWELTGTSVADLTLVASSSSVLLTSGCRAHFYVRGGAIDWC